MSDAMSLTSTDFIKRPEVADKLKPLRPKLPRKIAAPLRVEPRSNRYFLVGTAFDYLLRFELQRRAPHAVVREWVAEHVPGLLLNFDEDALIAFDPDWADAPLQIAIDLEIRASQVVKAAKRTVAAFAQDKAPSRAIQEEVAGHALRLARLDPIYYVSGRLEASIFDDPATEDVQDLLDMLAIVPFNDLIHDNILLLNPTVGASSLVADADLISGDMLLDFKVTKKNEMEVTYLDQLLGYFLLARDQRRLDSSFPEIRRFGLYFCRHGHLWTQDVTLWTAHPQFAGLEDWFFQHAREVFLP
jgi:hypothetical protein